MHHRAISLVATRGCVIVGTSFRQGSPFGHDGAGDVEVQPQELGYAWSVNGSEFQSIIDAARTIDPELSSDPSDYFVRSFAVPNEISRKPKSRLRARQPSGVGA